MRIPTHGPPAVGVGPAALISHGLPAVRGAVRGLQPQNLKDGPRHRREHGHAQRQHRRVEHHG
eukprot:CAMPEP_0206024728 /NCGR_PEP_ID=MMETSP1464-20131121/38729_1 /ASSEMBLY_ACC=CAM_ASM_001124 /TAXON_ID=119497 /ORGANISM="Exanthemachrysis gayraliae, Strain RCC1523" /LENGTH=62 /DNA_ID=CAMNT_0053398747 /DNA_START=101 /DNA_END=285 /DNA_ORIENTATION=-